MATFDARQMQSLTGLQATARTFLMVGFTVVETVALGLWLALVQGAPVISRPAAIGLGVLTVGLVVEHVLTDATVNGLSLSFPLARIVGISVSEALLWAVWLGIADRLGGVDGILVAGAVLSVLLVPQHSVEDNILRGEAPLSNVVNLNTIGFSLVEGIGATVWLLLVFEGQQFAGLLATLGFGGVDPAAVGLAALGIFLLVEHDIGVTLARQG
ncbi:hypothetical protein NDI85_00660 [Halomicroarcula sp. S1AR25-4]|uniref:hypothetical protein n=1 Tax=unclassified Haloarcula TaxID=2624677 RepID=UPI00140F1275|nr:hypothetical protein [Halomicroarcula sp. S1AR25-4]MDS0276314.1 hypothetical protein [Halomicroarcula sp. S1AR25-4]QIO23256.1 hypothetical protein G9465_13190 [Haloarcula sp. JP-L23]